MKKHKLQHSAINQTSSKLLLDTAQSQIRIIPIIIQGRKNKVLKKVGAKVGFEKK